MKGLSHETAAATKTTTAMDNLQEFIARRRASRNPVENMEEFEKELHALFAAAECEFIAEELARLDIDVPEVVVKDERYKRAIRCEDTYFSASGPVRVMRTLYRKSSKEGPCVCPLELRAGIVEGRWTPLAARQATWAVAHLTPYEAEELFRQFGGMRPSRSSLDRLPKQLSNGWEEQREAFEEALRVQEKIPEDAVSMAVSLDGVMVPMRDGDRAGKRARSKEQGRQTRGPAGHQEAGCATVSFYNQDGERLSTVRMARMPQNKKATLKEMLRQEIELAMFERPDLTVVKVADGARDNWNFLSEVLPSAYEVIDFYHATEHLRAAYIAAYGESSPKGRAQYEKYRRILRDEVDGVHSVIRTLRYLQGRFPRRGTIKKELKYFQRYKNRMKYAYLLERGLPIGSGVVEAACKTLVTRRLKCSGMRWEHWGGQAVLTFRSLIQSDRFGRAWQLLTDIYKSQVRLPENVVAFEARR
jgi:hypothetical protein